MKEKWITTEQMLETLKQEPDIEQQYCQCPGTTHWLEYSSMKKHIGDFTNRFDYCWYSEAEYLGIHAGEWWMSEV